MTDSLILMVLALVVFGPRRLPQIGRQIGKLMYEFRKASNDFKFQMEEELRNAEETDRRQKEEERLRTMALASPAPAATTIEATTPEATAINESPYPNEGHYPELTAAVAETPAEEAYPRIQPPTTGEQVPAASPTSLGVEVEAQVEQATEETVPAVCPESNPDINTAESTGASAPEANPSEISPAAPTLSAEPETNQETGLASEQPLTGTEQAVQHG